MERVDTTIERRHVARLPAPGEVAEWLKAADCKSARASVRWFESSPLHHHRQLPQFVHSGRDFLWPQIANYDQNLSISADSTNVFGGRSSCCTFSKLGRNDGARNGCRSRRRVPNHD